VQFVASLEIFLALDIDGGEAARAIDVFKGVMVGVESLALGGAIGIGEVAVGVDFHIDTSRVLKEDLVEARQQTLFRHSLDRRNFLQIAIKCKFVAQNLTPVEGGLRAQTRPLLLQLVYQ